MTLKEFSNQFDMSVNQMCEFTGYSRDGLNEIVKGNSHKNSEKKRQTLLLLLEKANELYEEEVKAARSNHSNRMFLALDIF